jgi:phospholipid/cholesterol/gamma-HCH transport system substrate-binding protein
MLLLVTIFVLLVSKEHAFESRFRLVAVFDSVSGLRPGAAVQLAGIDVGSVELVRFNEQGKAEVVMQIRERFREGIYENAVASLSTMGLLGDKILVLSSGTSEAGPVDDGDVIATDEYLQIGDIMDLVRPALENSQKVVDDVSEFLASLEEPVKKLDEVLESTRKISEQINAGEGTAGLLVKDPQLYTKLVTLIEDADETIRELRAVAEDVRVASQELPELSNTARETLGKAQQGAADFSELVDAGKDVVERVQTASENLPDLAERIDRVAENLEIITENVKVASGELPDLVAAGREGVEEGLEVVEAARKSPVVRRYIGKETEHGPAAPVLRDTNYSEGK